jgi:hypothetical protein
LVWRRAAQKWKNSTNKRKARPFPSWTFALFAAIPARERDFKLAK